MAQLKLNRRVTVRAWGHTQNEIGSPVAAEIAAWQMWAEVEDRSGFNSTPYGQTLWQYDYKVTVRMEPSRPIASNYTLDYNGKRLKINSTSPHSEAYRAYLVMRCTTISVSEGGVIPFSQIGVYDYITNEETDTFIVDILKGKYIFGAFKDGEEFEIIYEGVPVGRQVLFARATGTLTWGIVFNVGEDFAIQYTPMPILVDYNFTASSVTNTFTALAGKQIFGAFKDGKYFRIITTGTPVGRQVKFTKATGVFLWGIDFAIGETATIQYAN